MVLEDEKVPENRKLRRLENRKSEALRDANLLTFLHFTFLLSYFSKYLCLSVVLLSSFLFSLLYFLFPIFVKRFRALNR
jgi:hypothetical protein